MLCGMGFVENLREKLAEWGWKLVAGLLTAFAVVFRDRLLNWYGYLRAEDPLYAQQILVVLMAVLFLVAHFLPLRRLRLKLRPVATATTALVEVHNAGRTGTYFATASILYSFPSRPLRTFRLSWRGEDSGDIRLRRGEVGSLMVGVLQGDNLILRERTGAAGPQEVESICSAEGIEVILQVSVEAATAAMPWFPPARGVSEIFALCIGQGPLRFHVATPIERRRASTGPLRSTASAQAPLS